MNSPSDALREETASGNTAKFLTPLPGFHSYLPALFQAWPRTSHSFCASLITPLSARTTVGLGDETGIKREDVVTGFPWDWMGRGKNTSTGLFSLPAFLLCRHGDDSRCWALGKPCNPCHHGRHTDGACTPLPPPKEGSRFSLVEASANNSGPVTWNLLTKISKTKEREWPVGGDQNCGQGLQNPRASAASFPIPYSGWKCFVGEEALGADGSPQATLVETC